MKPPTTAVVGAGRSVSYPAGVTEFDWEIELAVVIGKTASCVPVDKAGSFVAGYTIGIDLSARDAQFHPQSSMSMDVFGGKAFDGSCPIGPWIIPAALIPDPQALDLRLSVNGVTKQSSNTRHMIWSVAEQLSLISHIATLEPGDVILTGTPSGSGLKSRDFLQPGDKISAMIQSVGTLDVEIMPAKEYAA
nr:fumarylacetoacetate hydrolase family protein [Sphingobium sp. EM0848]